MTIYEDDVDMITKNLQAAMDFAGVAERSLSTHWADDLIALDMSPAGVAWAHGYPDIRSAWLSCTDGRWMGWLVARLAGEIPWGRRRRRLVLACCDCARLALPGYERDWPDDYRPRTCIDLLERWGRGQETMGRGLAAAYYESSCSACSRATAGNANAAAYACAAYAVGGARLWAATIDAAVRVCERIPEEAAEIYRKHYPEPPVLRERAEG